MSAAHQLAQVNVARMRDAPDSPVMAGFIAAADPLYRLAEESPGFVWRLRSAGDVSGAGPACTAGGHIPTCERDGVGWQVVNVSVWGSYEALHRYVYRSLHGGLVRRRAEWFLPTPQPSTALWWLPAGARPTVDEALARLALLRRHGPTPRAFSLRRRFEPDGRPSVRASRGA